jgi:DNA-binding NtrC family response regulator
MGLNTRAYARSAPVHDAESQTQTPTPTQVLIGNSPAFARVLELVERMARYEAPVLIQGETGTGKELAARAIHYRSARGRGPFVPVNCGALPETLIESELYGCARGAFTDARQDRSGLIAAAEGGTLFLDELDSLPLRAQVSLLRFLQDQTYRLVGGSRQLHGDVRVIAAASPRLHELLARGAFRDDLAFRLNVLLLEMPPLRDRPGDARLLAEHFVDRHACQYGVPRRRPDAQTLSWMASYTWPGNVRELDNLVQRALLLSDGDVLSLAPLAMPAVPGGARAQGWSASSLDDAAAEGSLCRFNEARDQAMACFERQYLQKVMRLAGGNVTQAAQMAGKERRCLG